MFGSLHQVQGHVHDRSKHPMDLNLRRLARPRVVT